MKEEKVACLICGELLELLHEVNYNLPDFNIYMHRRTLAIGGKDGHNPEPVPYGLFGIWGEKPWLS